MTPDEYCAQRSAKSGSSFYFSFLFLPDDQRAAITALYAFCREVDDVVDEAREPQVARIKLAWWRDEIERAYAGVAQHPVARALQPRIPVYGLPREHFLAIIDGMEMDLDKTAYPDFDALREYCYRAAGVVGLLSARIFGFDDARTLEYAEHLGLAFQLTNILRDVREDAARGRVYLPQELLARHAVPAMHLHAATTSPELVAALRELGARAEHHYARALDALPASDRYRQRAGLIMAAIYRDLLREIERSGYRVLEQRMRLGALRKFWLAWSTARREKMLHLHSAA